jgi:hypothetical protein
MLKHVSRPILFAVLAGFFIGVIWLVAVRFITMVDPTVHHHANFALYINGERDTFDSFTFYEEVQSCGVDAYNNPKTRVHMHDNVNDLIHVHDAAATWGHFFANIGYTLGDSHIKTDDGLFIDGEDGVLTFILNGHPEQRIANRTIDSEDVLLISFDKDPDDSQLRSRFESISANAGEYNSKPDPSICSGSDPKSLRDKLWSAFGIGQPQF